METLHQDDNASLSKKNNPFYATNLWNDIVCSFRCSIKPQKHRYRFRFYDDCFSGEDAVTVIYKFLCNEREQLGNKIITREKAEKVCGLLFQTNIFESIPGYNFNFKDTPNKYFRLSNGSLSNILGLPTFPTQNIKLTNLTVNPNMSNGTLNGYNEKKNLINKTDIKDLYKDNMLDSPNEYYLPPVTLNNMNLKIKSAKDFPNLEKNDDCCLPSILYKDNKYYKSLTQSLDNLTIYEENPRPLNSSKLRVNLEKNLMNKSSPIISNINGTHINSNKIGLIKLKNNSVVNMYGNYEMDNHIKRSNVKQCNNELVNRSEFKDYNKHNYLQNNNIKINEEINKEGCEAINLKKGDVIERKGIRDDSGVYCSNADSINAFLEAHHYVTPDKKFEFKSVDKYRNKKNDDIAEYLKEKINIEDGSKIRINERKIRDDSKDLKPSNTTKNEVDSRDLKPGKTTKIGIDSKDLKPSNTTKIGIDSKHLKPGNTTKIRVDSKDLKLGNTTPFATRINGSAVKQDLNFGIKSNNDFGIKRFPEERVFVNNFCHTPHENHINLNNPNSCDNLLKIIKPKGNQTNKLYLPSNIIKESKIIDRRESNNTSDAYLVENKSCPRTIKHEGIKLKEKDVLSTVIENKNIALTKKKKVPTATLR